ncbi:MAG: hypothetical protein ACP5PR_00335 [Minisyncoccia bacterium]|jgi:hypothetical protein
MNFNHFNKPNYTLFDLRDCFANVHNDKKYFKGATALPADSAPISSKETEAESDGKKSGLGFSSASPN